MGSSASISHVDVSFSYEIWADRATEDASGTGTFSFVTKQSNGKSTHQTPDVEVTGPEPVPEDDTFSWELSSVETVLNFDSPITSSSATCLVWVKPPKIFDGDHNGTAYSVLLKAPDGSPSLVLGGLHGLTPGLLHNGAVKFAASEASGRKKHVDSDLWASLASSSSSSSSLSSTSSPPIPSLDEVAQEVGERSEWVMVAAAASKIEKRAVRGTSSQAATSEKWRWAFLVGTPSRGLLPPMYLTLEANQGGANQKSPSNLLSLSMVGVGDVSAQRCVGHLAGLQLWPWLLSERQVLHAFGKGLARVGAQKGGGGPQQRAVSVKGVAVDEDSGMPLQGVAVALLLLSTSSSSSSSSPSSSSSSLLTAAACVTALDGSFHLSSEQFLFEQLARLGSSAPSGGSYRLALTPTAGGFTHLPTAVPLTPSSSSQDEGSHGENNGGGNEVEADDKGSGSDEVNVGTVKMARTPVGATGHVTDALSGLPLSGVSVLLGGREVSCTGGDGAYVVDQPLNQQALSTESTGEADDDGGTTTQKEGAKCDLSVALTFSKPGFSPCVLVCSPPFTRRQAGVSAALLPLGSSAVVEAASGGVVSDASTGSSCTIPPDALCWPDGTPFEGSASVAISVIDANDPMALAAMPGNFTAQPLAARPPDSGGGGGGGDESVAAAAAAVPIRSFGAMFVSITPSGDTTPPLSSSSSSSSSSGGAQEGDTPSSSSSSSGGGGGDGGGTEQPPPPPQLQLRPNKALDLELCNTAPQPSSSSSSSSSQTEGDQEATMMPPSVYEFDDEKGTWVQTNGVVTVNGEKLPTAGTSEYNDIAVASGLPPTPLVKLGSSGAGPAVTQGGEEEEEEGVWRGRKKGKKGMNKKYGPWNKASAKEAEFKWAGPSMSVEAFRSSFSKDPRAAKVGMKVQRTGWFNCDSPYLSVLVSGRVGLPPGRGVGSSAVVRSIGLDYSGVLSARCEEPVTEGGGEEVGSDAAAAAVGRGVEYPFRVMAQFDSQVMLQVLTELPGRRAGDAERAVEAWEAANPLDWGKASEEEQRAWEAERQQVAKDNESIASRKFGPYETGKEPGTVLDVGVLQLD